MTAAASSYSLPLSPLKRDFPMLFFFPLPTFTKSFSFFFAGLVLPSLVYVSKYMLNRLFDILPACLSVFPSVSLSVPLSVCLSLSLSLCVLGISSYISLNFIFTCCLLLAPWRFNVYSPPATAHSLSLSL